MDSTRANPETDCDGMDATRLLLGGTKTISVDLAVGTVQLEIVGASPAFY